MKTCTKCNETKPEENFHKRNATAEADRLKA